MDQQVATQPTQLIAHASPCLVRATHQQRRLVASSCQPTVVVLLYQGYGAAKLALGKQVVAYGQTMAPEQDAHNHTNLPQQPTKGFRHILSQAVTISRSDIQCQTLDEAVA